MVRSVSAVSPSSVGTTGGATVTISGVGFDETSTVTVGDTDCTDVMFVSRAELTCVVPALAAATGAQLLIMFVYCGYPSHVRAYICVCLDAGLCQHY